MGASSIPQLLDEDKKLDGDMEDALLCKECNIYGIKRVLFSQPPTNEHGNLALANSQRILFYKDTQTFFRLLAELSAARYYQFDVKCGDCYS